MENQKRIQSFLSIMDTFHDFTYSRFSIFLGNEQSKILQTKVYQVLNPYFYECIENENKIINNSKDLCYKFKNIYKKTYVSYNGTIKNIANIEDTTVKIITDILDNIEEQTINKLDNQVSNKALEIYTKCKNYFNATKIIYILDFNSFGGEYFCINREFIDDISNNIKTSPYLYNTIFKGLFDNYEHMTPSKIQNFGGLKIMVKTNSIANNQDNKCIQFNDYFCYKLTSNDKELIFINEIGIKQYSSNSTYYLYLKINNVEKRITFNNRAVEFLFFVS
jgi:hypothetical protein